VRLKVAGRELAYDVQGQGIPLLLLHAFPLSRALWDPQWRVLSAEAQVIRFDARGFGESPPGDGLLTMERIADDAAALLDQVGASRAVLCGLSMGGYAAFAFARRHPTRLRALVLADTRAGADTPQGRTARAELAEKVKKRGPEAAAEAMLPKLLGATSQRDRPDLAQRVRELILANGARGICDGLAGLAARADSTPTLREIKVPTLVVVGEEDAITPRADAEAMQAGIPGSRLEVIPRAGHLSSLENPAAFNAAVSALLRDVPAT
jgi:3-oxoadipate enol-lactonase